ncbi:MAG: L-dopachrome tautomerase-related protein [Pseudomonadota bacterium]
MKKICPLFLSTLLSPAIAPAANTSADDATVPVGTMEVVAEMELSPGNVATSEEGRVFATIHPLRESSLQLVEIMDDSSLVPFPNLEMQLVAGDTAISEKFDDPLGLVFDNQNRLWFVDVGLSLGHPRVFAYDIDTGEELYRFDVPIEFITDSSFVQDLAIDEDRGFIYLADAADPAIIVIDVKKGSYRRIVHDASMASEDVDIVIDGQVQKWMGSPARIGINPITLSANRSTLFYGAMNGENWYQLPTDKIRSGESDENIIESISLAGPKPVSDGVATDEKGYHYFTNLAGSIDVLTPQQELYVLKEHEFIDWPDSVRISGDWLYVASNQIHKSPAFAEQEYSKPPYRVLRIKYR